MVWNLRGGWPQLSTVHEYVSRLISSVAGWTRWCFYTCTWVRLHTYMLNTCKWTSLRVLRLRPHVYVFKSTPFSKVSVFAVHTTTQRFRKSPFSKVSTFKPVFESLRFRWKRSLSKTLNKRLRVDGRRKAKAENEQKSLRFRMKTYTYGRGLSTPCIYVRWRNAALEISSYTENILMFLLDR